MTLEPVPPSLRFFAQSSVLADIWARRPGSGEIPAYDFDRVLGRRLTRAVRRNEQLRWGDLG